MPIKPCTRNGKKGYKWGDEGKCYIGKDAKRRAKQQGAAINAQKRLDKQN